MGRIDRDALDRLAFPIHVIIPTRFADLDIQGHVNNAAIPVILQEARVDFNNAIDLPVQIGRLRLLIAGITIEYAAELAHPGLIEIGTVVSRIGRTSFTIQQTARQDGRVAVYAETTLVIADANGAASLPEGLRRNLERVSLDSHTSESAQA